MNVFATTIKSKYSQPLFQVDCTLVMFTAFVIKCSKIGILKMKSVFFFNCSVYLFSVYGINEKKNIDFLLLRCARPHPHRTSWDDHPNVSCQLHGVLIWLINNYRVDRLSVTVRFCYFLPGTFQIYL